jgi:acetyl/propionyl-CoA carboxylase alpha subunit/acetyl-CoA carboxylase carboxyltransferase component
MSQKLLVANRGEIAIRIMRAAAELQIPTLAIYSEDDARCLHIRMAEEAIALTGRGAAAYLDKKQILSIASEHQCRAIHPGYGFLSENADFARLCAENGISFTGPKAETLELFGDKARARQAARECSIPLLPATEGETGIEAATEFLENLGEDAAVMVKALSGGGGRGMRVARSKKELEEAYPLCRAEAQAAFGNGKLYVERFIPSARHIEVQIVGDGTGAVSHLWERECSLQRRNQKLMEVAPSPTISPKLKKQLTDAAVRLAARFSFQSLGTFEFLVDADAEEEEAGFFFLEVNPRLQVEHTVTEEVTGIDLVKTQLRIARGAALSDLGLLQKDIPEPLGFAVQLRINMEKISGKGEITSTGGTLSAFNPPLGPGIRVDTFGYPGYTTHPGFDSLLAKLICHTRSRDYAQVLAKAYRALCEFRIEGVETNIPLFQNLLEHPDVIANRITTGFLEKNLARILKKGESGHRFLYFDGKPPEGGAAPNTDRPAAEGPEGTVAAVAPMPGTVVEIRVGPGDTVHANQTIAVLESMKMQHIVEAKTSGRVREIAAGRGDTLFVGEPLVFIEPGEVDAHIMESEEAADPDHIRPDLEEALSRHRATLDEYRPEAVEKRRRSGQRTARENIAHLVDPESFIEYGSLAVAAQRRRRSLKELVEKSPADGLITGIGSVNGDLFSDEKSRCAVLAYDYTALAGTQGAFNHAKTDRMLHIAEEWRIPLVLFAEGGGGRPGDVDMAEMKVAGLDLDTFTRYASLSGLVPVVGIVSGFCFAGNATLLGCSDVIIATKNANIGMGGPAMIEGGGLGRCKPEEIGPVEVQTPNGVIDILAEDEAEAVETAKKYLAYFQGSTPGWQCDDQRLLRRLIPENRLRAYDVRKVIETLADEGSVLEIRRSFGVGIITALIRIEGIPFGLTANNCTHLGGAIDADAADKAARFIKLLDAFDLPLITLCDTPGFMVGPEAEKTAQVRHFARMFTTAAGARIPMFSVVLRKGYGLGAMAMVGGGYHRPVFNVSWPTGEFGGMGLEGAVKLGFRKDLEAEQDPEKRQKLYDSLVAAAYEHGKAINMASFLEIDDVIDPAETRRWICRGLKSLPPAKPREGKKRPSIDTW